jgi:ketosteroid isomerase-like protein
MNQRTSEAEMTVADDAATKLIERYLAIVEHDDYQQFGELLTDDCTFTLMPTGHTWSGRDDVMSFVMAAGTRRTHDSQSKVIITNWFTNNEYLVVEYEHGALVKGVRLNVDGYCLVFHMRDGRFDSIREYINPSNAAISVLSTLVLRALPLLTRWTTRDQGPPD